MEWLLSHGIDLGILLAAVWQTYEANKRHSDAQHAENQSKLATIEIKLDRAETRLAPLWDAFVRRDR